MKYLNYLILLLYSFLANAQTNSSPRFTALGSTGVALQDVWSMQYNQAGIAGLTKSVASASFERVFAGVELSNQSAVAVIPFKQNVFGVSFYNYGFSAYNEQKIGLAYAKKFGDKLFAALNFNFHQLKISQYGIAQTFSAEGGIQFKPGEKLCLGAHISNPSQSGYNKEASASIPVNIEFGASFILSSKLLLNTGFITVLNSAADARAGLEYAVLDWFALRGGLSVNPGKQYLGFGLNYQKLHFDFAASSHQSLGYTPQVALAYEF